jgi:sulfite reductase alpha subunit-like flavoprotein
MPQDVRKILVGILREKGNMTEEEAQKYLQIMEQKNRYMTETWA